MWLCSVDGYQNAASVLRTNICVCTNASSQAYCLYRYPMQSYHYFTLFCLSHSTIFRSAITSELKKKTPKMRIYWAQVLIQTVIKVASSVKWSPVHLGEKLPSHLPSLFMLYIKKTAILETALPPSSSSVRVCMFRNLSGRLWAYTSWDAFLYTPSTSRWFGWRCVNA